MIVVVVITGIIIVIITADVGLLVNLYSAIRRRIS